MSAVVRVPASSANLGPGFDTLGMALGLHAELGFVDSGTPDGANEADEHHPATIAFRRAGGVGRLWVRSSIPIGRGMGYSGAVRVGGLVAAHLQQHGPAEDDTDRGPAALAQRRDRARGPRRQRGGVDLRRSGGHRGGSSGADPDAVRSDGGALGAVVHHLDRSVTGHAADDVAVRRCGLQRRADGVARRRARRR